MTPDEIQAANDWLNPKREYQDPWERFTRGEEHLEKALDYINELVDHINELGKQLSDLRVIALEEVERTETLMLIGGSQIAYAVIHLTSPPKPKK